MDRRLRAAGPDRRGALVSDLTSQALRRAMQGIAAAHAELDEIGRKLLFVHVHYGQELANRIEKHLRERAHDRTIRRQLAKCARLYRRHLSSPH